MKLILSLMFAALVVGCSHNAPQPCVATLEMQPLPQKDNFDKVGEKVADGGRYVYDEGLKAWRWATSEEMKTKYSNAWTATKETAGKAYDSAVESYKDKK